MDRHYENDENILGSEASLGLQLNLVPEATTYACWNHWETGDKTARAPSFYCSRTLYTRHQALRTQTSQTKTLGSPHLLDLFSFFKIPTTWRIF